MKEKEEEWIKLVGELAEKANELRAVAQAEDTNNAMLLATMGSLHHGALHSLASLGQLIFERLDEQEKNR